MTINVVVTAEDEVQTADRVGSSQSSVTVGVSLVFRTGINLDFLTSSGVDLRLNIITLHGVLSRQLEAGEGRRHITEHVVVTSKTSTRRTLHRAKAIGIADSRRSTENAHRAAIGQEGVHTAGVQRTEVARDIEGGFTTEDTAILPHLAGVRIKTVFKHEANLETIAEVFSALDAPAGTRGPTGGHFSLVRRDVIHVRVRIGQARVDATIEGHVSSHSRTGEGAENGDSNKSLFHVETPKIKIGCRPLVRRRD